MSIHDVSKNNQRRDNPMPNVHNHIIPEAVTAHNVVSTSYSLNPTADYTARVQMTNNNILVYDGSNLRIMFGVLPDGTYGMAISKVGYNVTDAYS